MSRVRERASVREWVLYLEKIKSSPSICVIGIPHVWRSHSPRCPWSGRACGWWCSGHIGVLFIGIGHSGVGLLILVGAYFSSSHRSALSPQVQLQTGMVMTASQARHWMGDRQPHVDENGLCTQLVSVHAEHMVLVAQADRV